MISGAPEGSAPLVTPVVLLLTDSTSYNMNLYIKDNYS
jgi:hypothetical protein